MWRNDSLYQEKDSREDYDKLYTNQKSAIRLARLKQPKKSGDASTISEVTSALTSSFTNMQEAIGVGGNYTLTKFSCVIVLTSCVIFLLY